MKKKLKKNKEKPTVKKNKKVKPGIAVSLATSLYMQDNSDPAHSAGHRKMKLKEQFAEAKGSKTHAQNDSAVNNMSRSDVIQRTSGKNRRILSGHGH